MVCAVANQKSGVGKTTTAINVALLLAGRGERMLVIDTDPQFALTRQLGIDVRSLPVNLVDILAGRALAQDAIVADTHGVEVISGAHELAGVEMSLVGELGRERFLHDALEPVLHSYDRVVIDTLRVTLATLAERLATPAPELIAVLTRWHPNRISSRSIEAGSAGSTSRRWRGSVCGPPPSLTPPPPACRSRSAPRTAQ